MGIPKGIPKGVPPIGLRDPAVADALEGVVFWVAGVVCDDAIVVGVDDEAEVEAAEPGLGEDLLGAERTT